MADKRIQDLTQATSIQLNDLFVLEQSGAAKSLTGQTLVTDLATYLSGHGGISNITYTPPVPPSLDGTLDITMADASTYSVTITNGNGIDTIDIEYGISNSGTDPIYVVSWESSPVAPTDQYPFGWTRIAITDTTGNTTNAYSVTVKADDPTVSIGTVSAVSGGSPSATVTNSGTPHDPVLDFSFVMQQGDKGDTGDYFVLDVKLGTSSAPTTEPSTWYYPDTFPTPSSGDYIWQKVEYRLHDEGTTQRTEVYVIGYIGQNGGGAGSVTQVTINDDTQSPDGTGNVIFDISPEDVGAIADPSTKSNGQVLTYDSSAGEWVAATPTTGNVNTVNNRGVDVGTTNITLYGTDIKMSSSDPTTVQAAIPAPATSTPADLGTAAVGTSTKFAREDHVHQMPSASDVGAIPAGDVQYKVYKSVTEINLTDGSATIAGAWTALPDYGILICDAAEFAGGQCPSTDGVVEIGRLMDSPNARGWIRFMARRPTVGDYRMFLDAATPGMPTGVWIPDDLYAAEYTAGTYTETGGGGYGFVTSSAQTLYLYVYLPKMFHYANTVKVTAYTGNLRSPSGGYVPSQTFNFTSYLVNSNALNGGTFIRFAATRSSGWGITNNSTVILDVSSITFTVT